MWLKKWHINFVFVFTYSNKLQYPLHVRAEVKCHMQEHQVTVVFLYFCCLCLLFCFPGPNHMPMQGPGPGPNQPPNMPSGSMNMPPSSHGSMGVYNHAVPSSQGMPAQSQMNMTQGQPMGSYGPRPNMNMQPSQGKMMRLNVSLLAVVIYNSVPFNGVCYQTHTVPPKCTLEPFYVWAPRNDSLFSKNSFTFFYIFLFGSFLV